MQIPAGCDIATDKPVCCEKTYWALYRIMTGAG